MIHDISLQAFRGGSDGLQHLGDIFQLRGLRSVEPHLDGRLRSIQARKDHPVVCKRIMRFPVDFHATDGLPGVIDPDCHAADVLGILSVILRIKLDFRHESIPLVPPVEGGIGEELHLGHELLRLRAIDVMRRPEIPGSLIQFPVVVVDDTGPFLDDPAHEPGAGIEDIAHPVIMPHEVQDDAVSNRVEIMLQDQGLVIRDFRRRVGPGRVVEPLVIRARGIADNGKLDAVRKPGHVAVGHLQELVQAMRHEQVEALGNLVILIHRQGVARVDQIADLARIEAPCGEILTDFLPGFVQFPLELLIRAESLQPVVHRMRGDNAALFLQLPGAVHEEMPARTCGPGRNKGEYGLHARLIRQVSQVIHAQRHGWRIDGTVPVQTDDGRHVAVGKQQRREWRRNIAPLTPLQRPHKQGIHLGREESLRVIVLEGSADAGLCREPVQDSHPALPFFHDGSVRVSMDIVRHAHQRPGRRRNGYHRQRCGKQVRQSLVRMIGTGDEMVVFGHPQAETVHRYVVEILHPKVLVERTVLPEFFLMIIKASRAV